MSPRPSDPRSGLDEEGAWTPAFEGQRPPFGPGNALGQGHGRPPEHGSYAIMHLGPRATEIASAIRRVATHLTPADEPALQLLGLKLAQLERAAGVIGQVDAAIEEREDLSDLDRYLGRIERRARLSQDARGWGAESRKLMNDLGLTPAGRAALEERTLTVVHVHEVQEAMSAFFEICRRLLPGDRWAEFSAATDAWVAAHDVGVRALPSGEESRAPIEGEQ